MLRLRSVDAHNAYKAVQWAHGEMKDDKQKILEMLFDGLAAALATSKYELAQGLPASSNLSLRRARRIVAGLVASLDSKYAPDLCYDLAAIYKYMLRQMDRVEAYSDTNALQDILEMTRTLREAWAAQAYPYKSVA
ncbi:MAG: flagellar export chaperone FliS [Burkholderiaceae bacterium]